MDSAFNRWGLWRLSTAFTARAPTTSQNPGIYWMAWLYVSKWGSEELKYGLIRELAQVLDLVVGHVYREVNAPADFMASLGMSSRSDHNFMSDFPAYLVGLARLDRMGFPYIRIG
ncbi:hypothetical protein BVC80_1707g17 [Macleaya cordata]|uniref:RNase H type-1 domain-containing protein n=1 Tax=Macleaya cordata TaxID=56857 RepID=A0A200Q616_MACCD|nr:hypothetical protein BVC80_1707g17 [Macleaya cordata]